MTEHENERLHPDHDKVSGDSGKKADPEVVVDAIRRRLAREGIGLDRDNYSNLEWDNPEHRAFVMEKFSDMGDLDAEGILPGTGPKGLGENARDDCGEAHPFVCPGCGHSVEFGRTCAQSTCSRCGVAWVRDTAIAKAAKLVRVRKEKNYHTANNELQKFHHQIISPSLSWWADLALAGYTLKEAYKITKKIVKQILDEMRAQGLLIFHPWRGKKDDGSLEHEQEEVVFTESRIAYDDDMGSWKEWLNSGLPFFGEDGIRNELAWNPHFHCIVVSDFLRGDGFTDYIEERTGWVIHRIAGDDGVSIHNDGQMAKVSAYSLSHLQIRVNDDAPNQSAARWVGSFGGGQNPSIKSNPRFTATPADIEWADAKVRRISWDILGLNSGSTECGATIPPVDDPNELARRILLEIWPDDRATRERIGTDAVLGHLARGNIRVEVETMSGGGGSVSVKSVMGDSLQNWGNASNLPDVPTGAVASDGGTEPLRSLQSNDDHDHDHGDDCDCTETMIPLGEARQRGFLDDDDWAADAPHADEAREADRKWPAGLVPWRTSSPGRAIGA